MCIFAISCYDAPVLILGSTSTLKANKFL